MTKDLTVNLVTPYDAVLDIPPVAVDIFTDHPDDWPAPPSEWEPHAKPHPCELCKASLTYGQLLYHALWSGNEDA